MQIAENMVVAMTYQAWNDAGELLDQAGEEKPFYYLHHADSSVPGLRDNLVGRQAGEKLKISLQPAQAYGEYDPSKVETVPRSALPGLADEHIKAGAGFIVQTQQGQRLLKILAIDGDQLTLDGNHPFAGVTLHFELNILNVRPATEAEMQAGQVIFNTETEQDQNAAQQGNDFDASNPFKAGFSKK